MMDLDQIHDNNLHEKYLLKQMSEKEQAEYEAFLKTHPKVRTEMEALGQIINGIRAIGHKKMKSEIADQVKEQSSSKIDWGIYYKLAAVLLLFVLLPSILYIQNQYPVEILPAALTVATTDSSVKKENPPVHLNKTESILQPSGALPKNIERKKRTSPKKAKPLKRQKSAKQNPKHAASRLEKILPVKKLQGSKSIDLKEIIDKVGGLQAQSEKRIHATISSDEKTRQEPIDGLGIIAGEQMNPTLTKKVYRYKTGSTALILTLIRINQVGKTPDSLQVFMRRKKNATVLLKVQVPAGFFGLPQAYIRLSKNGPKVTINFNNRARYLLDIKAKKSIFKKLD